jgi:hypothetical protein
MSQQGGLDWRQRLDHIEDTQYVADDSLNLNGLAIARLEGIFDITKGSAAAYTLALPVAGLPQNGGQDGYVLKICSSTAFAHTVTTPANGLNGANHILTFGAAVGNGVELHAKNGTWLVFNKNGVTVS